MIKGTLTNGFKFQVKNNAFKDYKYILEASKYKKDPEDFEQFDKLMDMTLGEEQKIKFVESFMDKEGNVPIDVLLSGYKEIIDIVTGQDEEIKN